MLAAGAVPGRALPAPADRRHVRGSARRRSFGRAARDPGTEPGRRLPVRQLVLALYGSIAGAESVLLALDEQYRTRVVMTEAPHGTAPALESKNIANPMAMILAAGALLRYMSEAGHAMPAAASASRAVYEAMLEATAAGIRTPDIGGHASTSEVTDEVVARVRTKLEIWASLNGETVA